MIRDLWAFFAQVVGEKAEVALKDLMKFSRRTNTVVKAQRGSDRFARWAAPLPLLVTHVTIGLRALKAKQFLLGLPFLPPQFGLQLSLLKRFLSNDKVVGCVQNANLASASVFLFHGIVQRNRRVRLVPKLQDERIMLHHVDPCKFNRAALSLNDHPHFSTRIANGNVLPTTAYTPRRGR